VSKTGVNVNDAGRPHQRVQPQRPQLKPAGGPCAEAWTDFCRRLDAAGQLILSKDGVEEPLLQAETLRYLVRELRSALEWEVDTADPDFPHFFRADDSGSGPPGPNLDNQYLHARVRGDASYRVTLDAGRIFDLLIGVTDDAWTNYGDCSLGDFTLDADGRLEIVISAERQPGNWLPMPASGSLLGIRLYYYDWSRDQPPQPRIERIDRAVETPAPLDPQTLTRRLSAAADWLETRPYQYPALQERWMDTHPVNTIPPPLQIPGGGGPIRYGFGRYRLQPDEALIVECSPPRARYWGFHLYTLPWFSQIDPLNRVTSLNGTQVHIDDDARVRIVVAHRDPGVQNWLDTGGLATGSFFYRWIWSEDAPELGSRVVPLAQLREHLPAGTPRFDPGQRAQQLHARRQHLGLRFRY